MAIYALSDIHGELELWTQIKDFLTKENYTDGADWCNKNNATIEDLGDGRYKIIEIPAPLPPTYDEVKEIRASLYRTQVDPLMTEYTRKKTFNLFEGSEEVELLAEVEAKVAEIKENNPYPEVEEV